MLSLRYINQEPGKNEPEEVAARIAEEYCGFRPPRRTQIEKEKSEKAPAKSDKWQEMLLIPLNASQNCKTRQRDKYLGTTVAVQPIAHVGCIDERDNGEHSERDRENTESKYKTGDENFAKTLNDDTSQ